MLNVTLDATFLSYFHLRNICGTFAGNMSGASSIREHPGAPRSVPWSVLERLRASRSVLEHPGASGPAASWSILERLGATEMDNFKWKSIAKVS